MNRLHTPETFVAEHGPIAESLSLLEITQGIHKEYEWLPSFLKAEERALVRDRDLVLNCFLNEANVQTKEYILEKYISMFTFDEYFCGCMKSFFEEYSKEENAHLDPLPMYDTLKVLLGNERVRQNGMFYERLQEILEANHLDENFLPAA